LETNVERLEGNLIRLTVTVPAEEVDRGVDEAYRKFAGELKIPGFRKGHVPPRVIDNYVGAEGVLSEAQEQIVQDSYSRALIVEKLRPIEAPDVGELDLPTRGADYTYSADVAVRPESELSGYEGLTVTVPPKEATDREIDAQIDQIREGLSTLEVVEDRGITSSDFALLSFEGLIGGEEYEGGKVDKYLYEFGKAQMPLEFEESLFGAKTGEQSSIPESVGKEATFDIEIHEIKQKVLPEIDDDLASEAGYDSVDDMREKTREQLDNSKAVGHGKMVEGGARHALAERLEGDIPESMIKSRVGDMVRDFANSLESQGVSIEQYAAATGLSFDTLTKEFEGQAEESVREELALESLFRALGMEITDEDVDAEIAEIVGEDSVQETRERFESSGIITSLEEQSMHRKATRWLMDNVEVIEEEPSDEEASAEGGDE